jgi:formylglycine-generating enzyme required for sulfatase activity
MKTKIRFFFHSLLLMAVLLVFSNSCKEDDTTKKDPVITWSDPADIMLGTVLSATQLNATADVPGTFMYTPAAGTKLNAGLNQILKVDFTPTDAATYNAVSKTVKINVIDPANPASLQLVNIPAGTFTMGSPTAEANRQSDETQHQVTLSAFRMNKYEITNAQYATFLNAKSIGSNGRYAGGQFPSEALIYESSGSLDWGLHYSGGKWIPAAGYENNPVVFVTWFGAFEFATYAGGTLPTEAQWEYACRGNATTPFNTGDCLSNLQANYNWAFPYNTCTNSIKVYPGTTQTVGKYAANSYGLQEMHGNVWEWCSDWYGTYPITAQNNPTGAPTGSARVLRGGGLDKEAMYCRSAFRNFGSPNSKDDAVGFRVVLVP